MRKAGIITVIVLVFAAFAFFNTAYADCGGCEAGSAEKGKTTDTAVEKECIVKCPECGADIDLKELCKKKCDMKKGACPMKKGAE